jgi:hypothetical protein
MRTVSTSKEQLPQTQQCRCALNLCTDGFPRAAQMWVRFPRTKATGAVLPHELLLSSGSC